MPKVEILTIHFGINHGSVLQCFALSETLRQLGAEPEVIDFVPPRYRMWNNVNNRYPDKPLWWKAAFFLASSVIRAPQKAIFRLYLKRMLPLSKKYAELHDLFADPPIGDVYISGSDQVWNANYNRDVHDAYFLPFAPDGAIRCSYAASLGRDDIEPEEGEALKRALAGFKGISVRETRGAELLAPFGIDARVDPDPVFLFKADEWLKLASARGEGKRYVLAYVIAQNYQGMLGQAREIADRLSCELYVLSVWPIRGKGIDRNFIFANPSDFLALIHNAAFVVANSFHGTAFSIIFNRPFLSYATKYNSRIESILGITGLKGRLVTDRFADAQLEEEPDFGPANATIAQQAERARRYLCSMIEGVPHD